jgi:putative ABC transport system substrate-binding protein
MVAGFGSLLLPACVLAQSPNRVFRVAYLFGVLIPPEQAPSSETYFDVVRQQLETHGFVPGRNLEMRHFFRRTDTPGGWAGPWQRQIIDEAAAWKADVMLIPSAAFVRTAKQARTSIPIVFALVQDPVSEGLVASLARPEANITGAGIDYDTLSVKRLELAREILPSIRRIAVVFDQRYGGIPVQARSQFMKAAERFNMTVSEIDVAAVEGGLCNAAKSANDARAQAILPLGNIGPPMNDKGTKSWVQGYGDCLYELQTKARIPVIDDSGDTVSQGVLAAVGEDSNESFRRAADVVARILKGAKPSDVPVDMQMRVELFVNAKSARQLGLKLPQTVVQRADRVIQ